MEFKRPIFSDGIHFENLVGGLKNDEDLMFHLLLRSVII